MTKVYLDTSAYNRPFDDQTQPKIFLESQAVVIILQMVETKMVELISSSVLEYFITCDKRLINRCSELAMKVMNPVNFVLETSSDDPSQE